jgi:hypothetical protein
LGIIKDMNSCSFLTDNTPIYLRKRPHNPRSGKTNVHRSIQKLTNLHER